ncbi:M1 family metallopeptidase [Mumia sp. zg.B21]|uniref:M1 family metallopeptidase n=1 Tax=Mumia sp. zg.B21 TaxID=2855447 RepID=UPI001C6EC038|nr:M1 family metallopeptidase [Mumia sp. zg.B21]MBW9209868.1 M1 family metallopeptidase [Mumia sp. zg.B21]
MRRTFPALVSVFSALALGAALLGGPASAHDRPHFTPGAAGIGDPYFPTDGNGGYDAIHYTLDVRYDPATDRLAGQARMRARATQNLSRFNLDLEGLTVRSVRVNGRRATWRHTGGELTITPPRGLRKRTTFVTDIRYDGVPQTLEDGSGFIHTDDGALVVGQPHVADTWYPVNDHPSDKASYSFKITAPKGLRAVANGVPRGQSTSRGWTTWLWEAREPMASYLTTATISDFRVKDYRYDGIRMIEAIDPKLYARVPARTGDQYAISQAASLSYKRLTRTVEVPAAGGQLSFWVDRSTEEDWDYFFVEARTPGGDDWTTLPDLGGATSTEVGNSCPYWLSLHPFLEHYQTAQGDDTCAATGSSGSWNAATGQSDGYEQWRVDLGAWTGRSVELSLTYASDDVVQAGGVFVDDITTPTGAGSTSFEADGDELDGWTVSGAPAGSEPNPNDWIAGTPDEGPATVGDKAEAAFAKHPRILDFLQDTFGRYPFSSSGGIVDAYPNLGFALENQTRPIYSQEQIGGSEQAAEAVVVHELAHQWYGDSLAVERWSDIWLNEGFASYAEWLWWEDKGEATAQEIFDDTYAAYPAEDPFWDLTIGDPGPDGLFANAVYDRGAMTLHQLRLAVGDDDFFAILRGWARRNAGGNVTTPQFIAYAERVSGQQLDDLFDTWLYTASRPEVTGTFLRRSPVTGLPPFAREWRARR